MSDSTPREDAVDDSTQKQLIAIARLAEANARRTQKLDECLAQVAQDVKTLALRMGGSEEAEGVSSWLLVDDLKPAVRILERLVPWLRRVYLRYPKTFLPSCWLWHESLVEELWVLCQGHGMAFEGSRSVTPALDWHERYLPGAMRRISVAVGDCELSQHRDGDAPDFLVPLLGTLSRAAMARTQNVSMVPSDEELAEAQEYDDARLSSRSTV